MMAQKIAAFQEFPLYCWEADYAGAPVSYIAAFIFHFFGSGFIQLRCAMLPFTLGTLLIFYFIYKRLTGPFPAFLSTLFLVFCPYFVLHYTTSALGGYGETFFGTALLILLSWKLTENPLNTGRRFLTLGVVSGFFFYILFLILPAICAFACAALLSIKTNRKKNALLFCSGGMIGLTPLFAYNIFNGAGTIIRSASRSTSLGRNDIHLSFFDVLKTIIESKIHFLKNWILDSPTIFGSYFLPVETSGKIFLFVTGLLAICLFCCLISCIPLYARSKYPLSEKSHKIVQFAFYFIFLVVFAWIANLPRTRHVLPLLLIIPVALMFLFEIKQMSRFRKALPVLFILLFTVNIVSWISNFKNSNFNPATVVTDMERPDCRFFYASYWCAYPLMFESKGLLCGSPMLLPYHEIFSDRRPDYTVAIKKAPSPSFFFGQYETALRQDFVNFLAEAKISSENLEYKEGSLFFHLSKPVDPVIKTRWNTTFAVRKSDAN